MSDRPRTPSSMVPEVYMESHLRFHENGAACEWGESYRPGGFHPVQIGDILNGQYEILSKLGYGSFATVWLAADSWLVAFCSPLMRPCLSTDKQHPFPRSRTFVAIKIHTARASQSALSEPSLYRLLPIEEPAPSKAHYLVRLLTSFDLIGPNGQHTCFVLEVMGPNLSDMVRSQEFEISSPFDDDFCNRFPKHLAKLILKETLHGLHFLHRNKVVHGDVHKGNILVNVLLPQYTADSWRSYVNIQIKQGPWSGLTVERTSGRLHISFCHRTFVHISPPT